jgi:hypothetical protein
MCSSPAHSVLRFLSAIVLFSGVALQAQPVLDPPCVMGTLTSYLDMDGGCSVGIQNFFNFTFGSSGTGGATLDTSDNIEVTPATGGFTFTQTDPLAPFSVAMSQTADYQIQYTFEIDPGPAADSASLGMDPPLLQPFGAVAINQYYCADSDLMNNFTNAGGFFCQVPGAGTFAPQDLHVDDTNPPISWSTGLVPLDPVVLDFAGVLTNIFLDGTDGSSGFYTVTGDSFLTPEPLTVFLALGGLLAIMACRRSFHDRP